MKKLVYKSYKVFSYKFYNFVPININSSEQYKFKKLKLMSHCNSSDFLKKLPTVLPKGHTTVIIVRA